MTSETASSQAAAAAAALPEAQLTSAPAAAAVPPQPQSPVSLPPQPLTTAAVSLLPLPLSLLCLMLRTCGTPQSLDAAATATVSARQSAQRSDRSVTGKRRITDTAEAAESEWQEAEGGDRRAAIRAYEDGMKVRRSSRTSSSLHFSHAVGLPAAASPLHVLSTARATCFICRSLISLNAGGRASATSTCGWQHGGSGCNDIRMSFRPAHCSLDAGRYNYGMVKRPKLGRNPKMSEEAKEVLFDTLKRKPSMFWYGR